MNIDRRILMRPTSPAFRKVHPVVNKISAVIRESAPAFGPLNGVSPTSMEWATQTQPAERAASDAAEGSQQSASTSSNSTISFENDSLTDRARSSRKQKRSSSGNGDFPDDGEEREPKRPR